MDSSRNEGVEWTGETSSPEGGSKSFLRSATQRLAAEARKRPSLVLRAVSLAAAVALSFSAAYLQRTRSFGRAIVFVPPLLDVPPLITFESGPVVVSGSVLLLSDDVSRELSSVTISARIDEQRAADASVALDANGRGFFALQLDAPAAGQVLQLRALVPESACTLWMRYQHVTGAPAAAAMEAHIAVTVPPSACGMPRLPSSLSPADPAEHQPASPAVTLESSLYAGDPYLHAFALRKEQSFLPAVASLAAASASSAPQPSGGFTAALLTHLVAGAILSVFTALHIAHRLSSLRASRHRPRSSDGTAAAADDDTAPHTTGSAARDAFNLALALVGLGGPSSSPAALLDALRPCHATSRPAPLDSSHLSDSDGGDDGGDASESPHPTLCPRRRLDFFLQPVTEFGTPGRGPRAAARRPTLAELELFIGIGGDAHERKARQRRGAGGAGPRSASPEGRGEAAAAAAAKGDAAPAQNNIYFAINNKPQKEGGGQLAAAIAGRWARARTGKEGGRLQRLDDGPAAAAAAAADAEASAAVGGAALLELVAATED